MSHSRTLSAPKQHDGGSRRRYTPFLLTKITRNMMHKSLQTMQVFIITLSAVASILAEDNEIHPVNSSPTQEITQTPFLNHETSGHDLVPMRADDVLLQDRWPNMKKPVPYTNSAGMSNAIDAEPQASASISYQIPHTGFPVPGLPQGVDYYGTPYQPLNNFLPLKEHPTGHRLEEGHEKHITAKDVAMAFLAYMAVLSILQGGIFTLIKDPPTLGIVTSARNKRETMVPVPVIPDSSTLPQEQSWILGEEKQIRCIQRSLCAVNRQLKMELGITGRILGQYISSWTAKSVDSSWMRLIADAGLAGMRGVDCDVLYRGCNNDKGNQT
ncbi:uncharacterized protein LOC126161379 [Schistocerca cancellata]|uniref:uncharacterized protein LOC126161379 n=1 Tax=Schistocerca cancellata TaxID=274614 RepID=UPI00211819B5|nr:uncharacterized protein LOC126161379 [Schistocerca cancellata]